MNELLHEAGLEDQKIVSLQTLSTNVEALANVIAILDPQAKEKPAAAAKKDPYASLMTSMKNLGLNNYMQPEDLSNVDKLKVMIRTAKQARKQY